MRRLILLLFLLLLLPACSRKPSYPHREPPKGILGNSAHEAVGRALFEEHCVTCHGTLTEGRSPAATHLVPQPTDLSSPPMRTLDPAFLFWRISKGKTVEPYLSQGSVMPAWGRYFSDRQIWDLVAYLRQRSVSGN